ncbi:YrbL family protein [Pseudovibrio sp. Tun.PSC04-5.I4]|uniref:YrbL family protein n=1 Tax=Pseudovibrio sp. Tun.PSC04-5.I4 TaxID=1798213 RepID=UPI00088A087B|nr:YrbL family protein [Pseudovibrio sp. Tun.PSC04-5.I4]SDQ71023.1 PhoP regulatory network protein YrbL [Pseudovibrio sp. Tun.PSC04-5.I4]
MIILNENNLIACGGVRKVYQHPDKPNLCVKVDMNAVGRGAGVTRQEASLFEQLLRKRNQKEFSVISNYRGSIETNLGFGGIFDLITDESTGKPSQILMKILQEEPEFVATRKFIVALQKFRRDLVREAVLCRDIRPWNICVQILANDEIRLVLIDGVGHVKKKWFEHVDLFVQIKMTYYFFSKYIFPNNRLLRFYTSDRKQYSWKAGPMFEAGHEKTQSK